MPQSEDESDYLTRSTASAIGWANDCLAALRDRATRDPDSISAVRYCAALNKVASIQFGNCGEAAFKIENSILILNSTILVKIFTQVASEIAHEAGDSSEGQSLSPDQHLLLCESILNVFLLHELHHIDQGVEKFEDIQTIKELGFPGLIAEFDVRADRNAVATFAELYADRLSNGDYIEAFKIGLSFSYTYFFRVFDFSTKPHKILRATSILLMLARILVAERRGRALHAPLDSALTFYGVESIRATQEIDGFVILAEQPYRHVYVIPDNEWAIAVLGIISAIEEGNFELALSLAMEIVTAKEA